MSLRKKAFFITLLTIIVAIPLLYYLTDKFFFENVIQMEQKQLLQNKLVANELINKQIALLDSINNDWSPWDDTYEFVQDLNQNYIDSNLTYVSLKAVKVNLMLFFGSDKSYKYGKGVNLVNGEPIAISDKLIQEIKNNSILFDNLDLHNGVKGLFICENKPYIIASRPILKSSYEGPSPGFLITLKLLTASDTMDISKTIKFPVDMEVINTNQNTSDFNKANQEIAKSGSDYYILPVDNQNIQIYFVRQDINGKNAITFMVEMPREVYLIGYKNQVIFLIFTVISILIFYMITLLLLNHYIFIPMNMLDILLNTIPAAIYFKNKEKEYISANKKFFQLFNIKRSIKDNIKDTDFMTPENAKESAQIDDYILSQKEPIINIVTDYECSDGGKKWLSTSKAPYISDEGKVIGIAGITTDVTAEKEMERKLEHSAIYDELTGLLKRNSFLKEVKQAIEMAEFNSTKISILYLNLDEFNLIADTYGHDAGDEFIIHVCKTTCEAVDHSHIVARVGDHSFAILLMDITPRKVYSFKDKFHSAFSNPWSYQDISHPISTSLGISIYPDDGTNAEDLLKNASTAMESAKDSGKNRYMFYNKNLTQKIFEKLETEKNLRSAIENDEFMLYYQPQVSIEDQKIFGVESLIRWKHPVLGLIPPYKFISVAEESNLIVPIGDWVLKTACKQAKEWSEKLAYPVKVSVNISSVQLYQHNNKLIRNVINLLNETGLPPELLELEITESMVMKDFDISCRILNELKKQGITLALDDFGTGYSSMVYLKNLPIDKIKIDQNFVRDIKEDSNDQVIVKTIVQLSKELGMSVIAEGIETTEQMNMLKSTGCNELQGYLFNKPIPANEFEDYFNSWDAIKDGYFK